MSVPRGSAGTGKNGDTAVVTPVRKQGVRDIGRQIDR